jgi:hypothetical protein
VEEVVVLEKMENALGQIDVSPQELQPVPGIYNAFVMAY